MGFDQNELLEKAASAIEKLKQENNELREKAASLEKRDRCEKIAKQMIEKGLLHDNAVTFTEKVAELMSSGNLDTVEEAVKIAVHGFSLGNQDDREPGAKGLNPIDALILGTADGDNY